MLQSYVNRLEICRFIFALFWILKACEILNLIALCHLLDTVVSSAPTRCKFWIGPAPLRGMGYACTQSARGTRCKIMGCWCS